MPTTPLLPYVGTVIYPVTDLAAAKAAFTELLGTEPVMDQPHYVGYDLGWQDIGLDPHGRARGLTAPLAYWHVADIAYSVQLLLTAGASEREAIHDVGAGKLVAVMVDRDGNPIGLVQPAPGGPGSLD